MTKAKPKYLARYFILTLSTCRSSLEVKVLGQGSRSHGMDAC